MTEAMTALRLAYAVLLPTAMGYLLVSACTAGRSGATRLERVFLGFGAGTGILTLEMFLLGLLKIPFGVGAISLGSVAVIGILAFLCHRFGCLRSPTGWQGPGTDPAPSGGKMAGAILIPVLVLGLWIGAKIAFALYEASLLPVHTSDSWTHWSSGAKFFYYERGLHLDRSSQHFFGSGYLATQRYPLHVPLLQVWFALCLGGVHEIYMKLWNSLYYVSLLGLVFFGLVRETTVLVALFAAFFLSSAPLITYHALTSYADLPLGYYSLGAAVCLWKVATMLRKGEGAESCKGPLVLLGVFVALAVWTKLEGLFVAVAFSIALFALLMPEGRRLRRFASYAAPVLSVVLAWYLFLAFQDVRVVSGEERQIGEIVERGLHMEAVPRILGQMFASSNFNLIFPFLLVLSVAGFRMIRRSDVRYLFLALSCLMVLYLLLYLGTESYRWVMNLTAVNRNLMTLVPMMYFLAGLSVMPLIRSDASRGKKNDAARGSPGDSVSAKFRTRIRRWSMWRITGKP